MTLLAVSFDVVSEALARRWVLAVAIAITLVLAVVALGLQIEVVDGALAATKLFGRHTEDDIVPVDVALRPIFQGACYVIYYGCIVGGTVAFADFAPRLLAPGRVEHLLSLPISRPSLLLGTFLGVVSVAFAATLYASAGFTVILGVKTGVYSPQLILSAALGWTAFFAIYGVMLTSAVFFRSAAMSAASGFVLLVIGIIASYRFELEAMFSTEAMRWMFRTITWFVPQLSSLGTQAASLAASELSNFRILASKLIGVFAFSFAVVSIGIWKFEGKDY